MVANALATTTPGFMQPAQWQMMTQQADVLIKSGFLPESVNTASKAIAIMMVGQELGILPWQSLSTINVINGKPTISPQLMLALIERSDKMENITVDGDATHCTVIMKRKGRDPHTETFTLEDAKKIITREKGQNIPLTEKYNWRQQPKVMLRWRAVAACARIVFPDVILGLYTPEEMGADVEVTDDGAQIVVETPKPQLAVVKSEPEAIEAEIVEDAPLVDHAQGGRADGTTEVSAEALTPRKQPAPEVVDPYADLRSQLEEAGVTTITSIKNITDTRVRIVTKEDYSAMLPGMLAGVKLTAAKVGERYFEIEWSEG